MEEHGGKAAAKRIDASRTGTFPLGFPLAVGQLSGTGGPIEQAAKRHDATAGQTALAWLLQRSPVMLPIPGTSSVRHVEEDIAAAGLLLGNEEFAAIGRAAYS